MKPDFIWDEVGAEVIYRCQIKKKKNHRSGKHSMPRASELMIPAFQWI